MGEYYTHVEIRFKGGAEDTKKFNELIRVMDKEGVINNQDMLNNINLDHIIQNALFGKLKDRGENSGFNCRYFPDFDLSLAPMLVASLFPKCSFSMELRWEYSVGGGESILMADYKKGELFFRRCQTDADLDEEIREKRDNGEIEYDEIVEMLLKDREKVKPLRSLDYEESFYKGDLVSYLGLDKDKIKCDFFDENAGLLSDWDDDWDDDWEKRELRRRLYYEKLLDEVENKNALTGLLFVLTGDCNNAELDSFIRTLGGETKDYVVKKTNYVIGEGRCSTTKIERAEKYGIEIINLKQFLAMLNLSTFDDREDDDEIDDLLEERKKEYLRNRLYYEKLLDEVENKNALTGLRFALCGDDVAIRELCIFIETLGGEVYGYISKTSNINYVIAVGDCSGRQEIERAEKYGIEIINLKQFLAMLNLPELEISQDKLENGPQNGIDEALIGKGIEGLKFVVTGDIEAFPDRDDFKKYIEEHGGKLIGSVSSKTDYLITNTPDSGTVKNQKARELGIKIINEKQFFDMIKKD